MVGRCASPGLGPLSGCSEVGSSATPPCGGIPRNAPKTQVYGQCQPVKAVNSEVKQTYWPIVSA